jgi:hypothetical protein
MAKSKKQKANRGSIPLQIDLSDDCPLSIRVAIAETTEDQNVVDFLCEDRSFKVRRAIAQNTSRGDILEKLSSDSSGLVRDAVIYSVHATNLALEKATEKALSYKVIHNLLFYTERKLSEKTLINIGCKPGVTGNKWLKEMLLKRKDLPDLLRLKLADL